MNRLVLILLLASLLPGAAIADSSQTTTNSSGNDSVVPASATTVQLKNGKAAEGDAWSLSSIPEPGTLCLLGTGLLGLAGFMRRRLRAKSSE